MIPARESGHVPVIGEIVARAAERAPMLEQQSQTFAMGGQRSTESRPILGQWSRKKDGGLKPMKRKTALGMIRSRDPSGAMRVIADPSNR